MSTNWLKDKSIEEWDSSDDEYIEEEMNGSLEWMNHDSEYGMEMPSSMRKYKDKYAHDSDSSDGEDPEIADDDEMVSVKSPTGALRKRVPTNKRR